MARNAGAASSSCGIGQCLWQVAAAMMIASSLAVIAVFADVVVPSQLFQTAAFAPTEVAWALTAPRSACRNWAIAQIGPLTVQPSADQCGQKCRSTGGCIAFGYATACAMQNSCMLLSESCEQVSNTCWSQYGMEADKIAVEDSTTLHVSDRSSGKRPHSLASLAVGGAGGGGSGVQTASPTPASPSRTMEFFQVDKSSGRMTLPAPAPTPAPVAEVHLDPHELPKYWPVLQPRPPQGVNLPEGWSGPWDHEQRTPKEAAGDTFGFYFPVFNQAVPAILSLLESVRTHYPDSPVHVLQDGGFINFGAICTMPKYRCTFEQVAAENSRWNPHSWMLRLRKVAKMLKTTYVIYLEPDVIVRNRHRWPPSHDAGGIYDNFNPGLHEETIAYMQELGRRVNPCFKVRWRHFGLAGGSYFRTAAILDAFDGENLRQIDWRALYRFEGERVFSSDLAMHVALSARGYTVYPWRESAQKWNEEVKGGVQAQATFAQSWPAYNPLAAFEHNHKEHYGDQVPHEERELLRKHIPQMGDVWCHGCVWYEGPRLDVRSPMKQPQSWTVHPPPELSDEEFKYNPAMVKNEKHYPEGPSKDDVCFKTVYKPKTFYSLTKSSASVDDGTMTSRSEGAGVTTTTMKPSSVTAPSIPSSAGLPLLAQGPSWLVAQDGLVIDARPGATTSGGGVLIAQVVTVDGRKEWGGAAKRPGWVRAAIATNRNHARLHGHAMVIRWNPTLRFPPPWQEKMCDHKENAREIKNCWLNVERENFNWEKHQMMVDYLQSPQKFSHVLVLDADAVLVNHNLNVVQEMAQVLEDSGKQLFMTNEDWIGDISSKTRINGGLLFAKNTPWVLKLFQDMLDSHWYGPSGISNPRIGGSRLSGCASNEQLCIDGLRSRETFKEHVVIMPGYQYNCGTNDAAMKRLKAEDPTLKVLHFMGGAKSAATRALCTQGKDLTGDGPTGYGCAP